MITAGGRRRLADGGAVDRARPLRFRFDGRRYVGLRGDTLASALLANGVRVVGRSFKYHRPRGVVGAGVEECNALVQLGQGARSTPNMRATEVVLHEGLTARAVNCWPSARFDVGAVNSLLSRFLAAGFYYKTFMWPNWRLYEGTIRRAAGLGKVAKGADPDRYEIVHAHCDVLVVGSGPAGMAAALAASAGGARVILAEQDRALGGQLRWDGGEIDGLSAAAWIERRAAGLRSRPEVRIMTSTTVTGYFDHNSLTMLESVSADNPSAPAGLPRYRQWQVRAGRVVLATGAIERPLVFPGNDRPGIMLASAVRQYIAQYAVRPGDALVVFTNNDEAYRTAAAFQAAGGKVVAIVDTRAQLGETVAADVERLGVPVIAGGAVIATRGAKALRSVMIRTAGGEVHRLRCDLLVSSGGANPTIHLFSQSGGRTRFDDVGLMFRPDRSMQAERSVGAADGGATLSQALASGHTAGEEAAAKTGFAGQIAAPEVNRERPASAISPCWSVEGGSGKAFVDMQNDVATSDIALSVKENFVSVEHLKRYTTLGMASDQGKTANVNAIAILAQLTDGSIAQTGTTRFRFPFVPTPIGAFAGVARGELFRPLRRLELHDWHAANGAVLEDFGGWLRPGAYLRTGETRQQAERREARAVREGVGLFDASPLGKIEVRGPDAARFLDFVYANAMSSLKVGKVRYGLFLNERGVVLDDGVCTRIGQDHFLVGTSSGGAERIYAWLEEWLQCEFPAFDVLIAPVTTSWAVLTLAGPRAREVLNETGADFAVGAKDFPHMSLRAGRIAGVQARVLRVSFTGETSYEINVATDQVPKVWATLYKAGQSHGLQPFGIDALNLLRLEKGYLHVGTDTDGTTTPRNIGWGRVLERGGDFIGKRSLLLPVNQTPSPLQLVGLIGEGGVTLPIGTHAVRSRQDGRISDGFVTSSAFSPTLGRGVALAMIHDGPGRLGEKVALDTPSPTYATIADTIALDPKGERLHG